MRHGVMVCENDTIAALCVTLTRCRLLRVTRSSAHAFLADANEQREQRQSPVSIVSADSQGSLLARRVETGTAMPQ